jgi:hypothetical protein
MRRFLICLALLLLTLLIGRSLDAKASDVWSFGRGDWRWSDRGEPRSIHLNLDLEDEDLERPMARSARSRRYRSRDYPREHDGQVRFRLEDRGYDRVYLEGSFFDWQEEPMRLDAEHDVWVLDVPLERGRHRYLFVIEDERGRRRRTDPSHSQRAKRSGGRWVSEIEVDRDGDVRRPQSEWRADYDLDLIEAVTLSYQRVDGLLLGVRPSFSSPEPFAPWVRGWLGYGFASSRWSGQLTLLQPLTYDDRVRLILSGYDRTDYTPQTGVGSTENTLAAWIFREDSRDYHQREGVSFGLGLDRGRNERLTVLLRSDRISSLSNEAHASWGWGRDRFLPNPPATEGVLRSVVASLRLGHELRHLVVDFEIADDDLATTVAEFAQITAQARTRLRLGRLQYLDLRVKAGTTLSGELPVQKRYRVGGLGTVRGYAYQSLLVSDPDRGGSLEDTWGGERMLLLNAEYAFGVVDEAQLVLLFDSGMAWQDRNTPVHLDELRSSVGLGIQSDDGGLRLDFVKRLQGGGGDILVQARIQRPF